MSSSQEVGEQVSMLQLKTESHISKSSVAFSKYSDYVNLEKSISSLIFFWNVGKRNLYRTRLSKLELHSESTYWWNNLCQLLFTLNFEIKVFKFGCQLNSWNPNQTAVEDQWVLHTAYLSHQRSVIFPKDDFRIFSVFFLFCYTIVWSR